MKAQESFGEQVWAALCEHPLGSLTKRELELLLLQSAIATGILQPVPWQVAQKCRLSLTKAHSYLTDLALRLPELEDFEGVTRLIAALQHAEVTQDENHLAIPLNDASLRIWTERKLSTHSLHPGESIRRELVKITPAALYRILDDTHGLQKPYKALDSLSRQFKEESWYASAKAHWKPETPWADALKNITIDVLREIIPKLFSVVTGIPFA
jgi:hypothetical protein